MPPKKTEEVDLDAQLAKLTELSDDELTGLEAKLVEEFDAADKDEAGPDVAAMEVLAENIDKVRAEGQARAEKAEEAKAEAAKIRDRVHEPKAEEETEQPKAEAEDTEKTEDDSTSDDDSDDSKSDDDTEVEVDTTVKTEAEPETEETPEQIAAAIEQPQRRPSLAQIMKQRPKKAEPVAQESSGARIMAAGDVANISAGQQYRDMTQMGRAVEDKGRAILASGARASGQRFPIAHVEWEYPEERSLKIDSPALAEKRVESLVASLRSGGMDALTAAGGLCAPVSIRYELFTLGDARRPIRDALARFDANRGGITFNAPPTLAQISAGDGVNRYTETADTNSTGYPKGHYDIACGDPVTVNVQAIVARGRIGNFQRRFNPESWDASWNLILTEHARVAENALWDSIETDSTVVETGVADVAAGLGTTRSVLRAVALAVEGLRYRHRIPQTVPIRVLAPEWLRGNMREDLAAQQPGDDAVAVADAQISAFFAARGVAVTWSPDAGNQNLGGAQGAGALNPWPDLVQFLIFPEGTHLFLDGGELNFGLEIRDSTLNDTNDVEAMTETFEESAKVGPESLALTVDICASGATKLPVNFAPCTSGS